MKQEPTKWEATDTPGLYIRRPGAGFYARITTDGKRSWRSLKTDKLRKAQALLRDLQSGHVREVSTRTNDTLHAAMRKVVAFRSIRRGADRPLKSRTVGYHAELLKIAEKLFPDKPLASFDAVGLLTTIQKCGYSQSRRKAISELLKRTFADAVENGDLRKNPLAGRVPGQVPKKDRTLPTRNQIDELVKLVQELNPRYGHRAAFTLRFLAFSGLRIDEAKSVTWDDIKDGRMTVRGSEEGTKTYKVRVLDINAPLQAMLDDVAAIYGREGRVMPAKSILKQLAGACKKLKLPALNHHDLRSFFITWNITSGTDISTLAGWVGNGPKVLLERYASVQDENRRAAAKLLS